MAGLELKEYQRESLNAIARFCDAVRKAAGNRAVRPVHDAYYLESVSAGGFCLPLAPGNFFPDFVVELNDGRMALVEYKGGHLANGPKELHKKDVGELWAARSGGKCVFVWVVDRDWATLEAKLNASGEAGGGA